MNLKKLQNEEYQKAHDWIIESLDNYNMLVNEYSYTPTDITSNYALLNLIKSEIFKPVNEAIPNLKIIYDELIRIEVNNDDEQLNDLDEYKELAKNYIYTNILVLGNMYKK